MADGKTHANGIALAFKIRKTSNEMPPSSLVIRLRHSDFKGEKETQRGHRTRWMWTTCQTHTHTHTVRITHTVSGDAFDGGLWISGMNKMPLVSKNILCLPRLSKTNRVENDPFVQAAKKIHPMIYEESLSHNLSCPRGRLCQRQKRVRHQLRVVLSCLGVARPPSPLPCTLSFHSPPSHQNFRGSRGGESTSSLHVRGARDASKPRSEIW